MRFLYIAPRYHTNQIPIMKGLLEHGHEVCFISHYAGNIEDYSYVTPIVAGYSGLFLVFEKLYTKVLKRKDSMASNMKLKYGFPPAGKIAKLVKAFAPDVVIIRERSVYSIFAYLSIRKYHCSKILYNQSPYWEKEIKNDLPHRIVRGLLPEVRMTPVMGERKDDYVHEPGAVYIPFVMEPKLSFAEKTWFRGGEIHLFCVGKYEKRKNIDMLLAVLHELGDRYPVKLTVAGECTNRFQIEYKQKLEKYIRENELTRKVELLTNLSREQMEEQYGKSDLFVIPSTREPASVSQLEAMAFSLPVICGDKNGTACYVKDGKTGYLFKDNDKESLRKALESMVGNKEQMMKMGRQGYQEIADSCNFDLYYQGICECMKLAADKKSKRI